jgi:probable rRNA maturation factor
MTADDPDPRPAGPPARLQVVVTDGRGRPRSAGDLPAWLGGVAPPSAAGLAVVALVCDRKMRDLNRRFRAIDRVTDVLSFPAETGETAPPGGGPPGGARLLGDIVIATGRAARQARAAGLTESQEWRRLALHGLLHLLGYDHERDDGRMRRLERRLQRRGGLPVDGA